MGVEAGDCVRESVGGARGKVGVVRDGISWICVSPEALVGRAIVEEGMRGAVKETGLAVQAANANNKKRAIQ
jgi:hypothetical protein